MPSIHYLIYTNFVLSPNSAIEKHPVDKKGVVIDFLRRGGRRGGAQVAQEIRVSVRLKLVISLIKRDFNLHPYAGLRKVA